MAITRNFKLFLNAGSQIPLLIHANQYDSGEQWRFTLYNQDGSVYEPESGAIVGIKSDGKGIINTGSVSGGKVIITETQQMTAAAGKATFELMIDGGSHGTANFSVLVEPKPGDQADLSDSDLSLIQEAINSTTPANIASAVSTWMSDNLTPTTPVVDASLSTAGAAADAKKTGDEISDLKSQIDDIEEQIEGGGAGSGLTSAIKSALMQFAQNVAFKNTNGQTYVDDLYDALYPTVVYTAITLNKSSLSFGSLNTTQSLIATTTPRGGNVTWSSSNTSVATVSQTGVVTSVGYGNATITATCGSLTATCSVAVAQATVTSISASYTQSGAVYTDTALNDLKTDLVVTASWSNGTTSTVASNDYTLSGTLAEGTSTVTVAYSGQTTTFNVTVTEKPAQWTFSSMTDGVVVNGTFANATGATCGMILDQIYTNRRRSYALTSGITDTALANSSGSYENPASQHSGYYPIPIPAGATQFKVSVTPSTQYVQVLARLLDDGVYSQMTTQGPTGYQTGSITRTFDAVTANHSFLFITTKYDNAGTSYPTEPTEIKVEFS